MIREHTGLDKKDINEGIGLNKTMNSNNISPSSPHPPKKNYSNKITDIIE